MSERVLVTGGRRFDDRIAVERTLDTLRRALGIACVIQGGAPGADALAREWAERNGIEVQTYEADWDHEGPAAGPIRNRRMLLLGKPDRVLAFPGGKGTADMVRQAERAGVRVTYAPTGAML